MIGMEEGVLGSYDDETEMTCRCIPYLFSSLYSWLRSLFRPRHEVETQHRVCEHCKIAEVKNRKLEEDKRKLQEELHMCHQEYQRKIESLSKLISELQERLGYKRDVSAAFDGVEDMNDPFSNAKIADKFHTIQNREWHTLFTATELLKNGNEIGALKQISAYSKEAYILCKDYLKSAREQRRYILKEENRHIETEKIIERISKGDEPAGFSDALRRFLHVYIDSCLLMVTSQPPIFLEFDVVGQHLKGKLKERFYSYSPQDIVRREENVDTIVEVVWPELNDHFGVHKKGLVVVVDEKIEDNSGDNSKSADKYNTVHHSVQNTTQSGVDNFGFNTEV